MKAKKFFGACLQILGILVAAAGLALCLAALNAERILPESTPALRQDAPPAVPATEPPTEEGAVRVLQDADLAAPVPDASAYSRTNDPAVLAQLVEGLDFYFDPARPRKPDSEVSCYSDETILCLVWQEVYDQCVYTCAEVKIAHSSQFRRFLSGGKYDSGQQVLTSEMAASVNAVLASSADFYSYRTVGTNVYMGNVYRADRGLLDTCMIDENGDLIFQYAENVMSRSELQSFVDSNGIRFALSFGPILVDNGVRREISRYGLGQPDKPYARAALCQMGPLHYLLVAANYETENGYTKTPTIWQFGDWLATTGCQKAYALDGGQTATITLDGQVMNQVSYGSQRKISDIIYFATALPAGSEES